jgi:hypothetical protein
MLPIIKIVRNRRNWKHDIHDECSIWCCECGFAIEETFENGNAKGFHRDTGRLAERQGGICGIKRSLFGLWMEYFLVNEGTVQGSDLGPVLFNLCIRLLLETLNSSAYADYSYYCGFARTKQ